ncbi:mannose-6-phosphate isomerase-like protein (cupin superfamily) [Sphingobium sp. B1D7B]|uniref:cupin domain-containing protein n=1 Tax=unclassified Sphingobium TaxID=2611147 RepID=UPI0022258F0E|nr:MULTISPECIES: cupin domain-containing protein [unclassified Sphingobium]MCW2365430.1 mannose-6-phosphate isomerase-like protein (cupin superfamily) [Sphingobium sp. B7D2B]MCW2380925.1 mannose-6-phosphate isomerase-like protein (cupin superfamily) [Sphingobium sp. B2D3B]MCW2393098.1 mannose-6-phosphate isomerase-like protein (cupin superfamily) [Sphingobium sp. B11D3A]MCW2398969.1 mannose-6-phosphate isomerase-like protein (cupin superfamily) [Sphingobium sp. B2D3C]MCW2404903.1 mannose-6-pho
MNPAVYLSRATELQAFRIAPTDTNYFVILHDKAVPGFEHVCVVEIFEPGGKTPPNSHKAAFEFFYVLEGEGRATCDGASVSLSRGSAMLLPPGGLHVIENTGPGKLYTLTVMTPDEGFSDLIRSGVPVDLDASDIALLSGDA